jgi:four helix bundle protein
MRDYRKLEVWKKGHNVVLAIYKSTRHFPAGERFGLTSQIRRSSASVPTNIAEGCGHSSDAEFARFLQLAAASASETEYQLLLAKDLNYISQDEYAKLSKEVVEIKKMLHSFVSKVKARSAS